MKIKFKTKYVKKNEKLFIYYKHKYRHYRAYVYAFFKYA